MPVALSSPRYGWRWAARIDTPRNVVPRMIAIVISVRAALRDSGRRKAGTPFDTASTPDSATAPDEKARSNIMNERVWFISASSRPSMVRLGSGPRSKM